MNMNQWDKLTKNLPFTGNNLGKFVLYTKKMISSRLSNRKDHNRQPGDLLHESIQKVA